MAFQWSLVLLIKPSRDFSFNPFADEKSRDCFLITFDFTGMKSIVPFTTPETNVIVQNYIVVRDWKRRDFTTGNELIDGGSHPMIMGRHAWKKYSRIQIYDCCIVAVESVLLRSSSRGNFRLQWEGPKNTFKRLFLAAGCYNFLLKPYLKNFRKFSNTPSVPKCPKFKTLISVLENEKSVNLKNRFSHYSSRMVLITYFFNAFGFFAEKIWGYLSSSRAFFWVNSGIFGDFLRRVRFWYCSSRMVVITYFH